MPSMYNAQCTYPLPGQLMQQLRCSQIFFTSMRNAFRIERRIPDIGENDFRKKTRTRDRSHHMMLTNARIEKKCQPRDSALNGNALTIFSTFYRICFMRDSILNRVYLIR